MNSPVIAGHSSQVARGILLMLMAVFFFSSHDTLSKYLSGFYPIVMVVWARYAVHTTLMAALFLPRQGLSVLHTKRPWLRLARALFLLGISLFFICGLRYLPLAEATAFTFLTPMLVTALSAVLLREKISRSQWGAVLLGLTGVLIIVRPGSALFTPAILLPTAAALCFAFYQLLTRMLSDTDSPATSNFLTGAINTLIMTVLVVFFWQTPTFPHALLMFALGAFGMLAHMLMTHSFGYAAPAVLAPFSYGQLLFSGMWGYVIFDHMPDHGALLGMAIIAISGLGIAIIQGRQARKAFT